MDFVAAHVSTTIWQQADLWAKTAGYASAEDVPMRQMPALISAVAEATQSPLEAVREALLTATAEHGAAVEAAVHALGLNEVAASSAEHRPACTTDGISPLGLMLRTATTTPPSILPTQRELVAISELNAAFAQTATDFAATHVVVTRAAGPKALRQLTEACAKLLKLFSELDGARNSKQARSEIARLYGDLLSLAARSKGVTLTKTPPEAPVIAFRAPHHDPHSSGHVTRRTDRAKVPTASSVVFDEATGKAHAFGYQGEVVEISTIQDFVLRHQEALAIEDAATAMALQPATLESLRSLDETALAHLRGAVEHVTLNGGADDGSARVMSTKWHRERGGIVEQRVICEGPFRGILLDDLVNEIVRQRQRGVAIDPLHGLLSEKAEHNEPALTTTTIRERGEIRDRLFIRIPPGREWTTVRRSLRRLSELEPSVRYREGSGNTSFSFPPDYYKLVREIVGDMRANAAAVSQLDGYFAELTRVELASADASLSEHTAEAVGGFRAEIRNEPFSLSYWQRKSLAWLSARDYKGVIALDTGMGKTLIAIATLRELIERHGEQRPFLIVGPPGLRGNIATEILKFCTPEVAQALVDRLVVVDYREFARASRTGILNGEPFSAERFGAAIFDEAHHIKNRKSVGGAAALAFKHPHKIVLTKSVLKDNVDDVFTLACIANNVDLNDRTEGKEQRHLMRKFRELYCNVVGGRTVGVKEAIELAPGRFVDPKHSMHAFIKVNFLHADKRVDDVKLHPFKRTAVSLTMPAEMEAAYREKTRSIAKILQGMVSLYRDRGITREYIDDKGRTRREMNPLARNKDIAGMFGSRLRGLIHEINDLTNTSAKTERATEIIWKHVEANPHTRAVLFSDSSKYVIANAKELSLQFPGKVHAACLANEIRLYRNGQQLTEYKGMPVPFRRMSYTDRDSGRVYPDSDWQKFAIDVVLGRNPEILTSTMFGPAYQEGQNMQWANLGIHLDRDTWSAENIEQREGRLWRQGQTRKVCFYNIDWMFNEPKDDFDYTLDQVRGLYEKVGSETFHDIIVVPQSLELGGEWGGLRSVDDLRIDRSVIQYAMAPTATQAAENF